MKEKRRNHSCNPGNGNSQKRKGVETKASHVKKLSDHFISVVELHPRPGETHCYKGDCWGDYPPWE